MIPRFNAQDVPVELLIQIFASLEISDRVCIFITKYRKELISSANIGTKLCAIITAGKQDSHIISDVPHGFGNTHHGEKSI